MQPSPAASSLLAKPLEPFTHRHLLQDTDRQRAVLASTCEAHANGSVELDVVVSVLRHAGECLAAGAAALVPELTKLVRACAVTPLRRRSSAQEVASYAARSALLDVLASLARSAHVTLRNEAADALDALLKLVSWPIEGRPASSLPPSHSMAAALAHPACLSAPVHAVTALVEADSESKLRNACGTRVPKSFAE